jgi:hypothetical protein
MKKYLLAIVGTMIFSSSALAAGYGDAGCGLGSLVFGNQSGAVQILAATTNGTGMQSFGITSGTSNCDAKGIVLAEQQQKSFAANNFSGLAKEMATGDGEQLTALAGLMGCPVVQQTRFNTVTQRNYAAIFASDTTTPTEMLTAVKTVMSGDAELSAACSVN